MTLQDDGLDVLLVDGGLVPASGGGTFETVNPATEEVLGVAADGTAADMDAAIGAARQAFDESGWATDLELRVRCIRQLREPDAIRRRFGKRHIRPARLRELRVQVDRVPYVDHHQKRRPRLWRYQGPRVLLRLASGAQQRVVPRARPPHAMPFFEPLPALLRGLREHPFLVLLLDPLLRLQDETATLIKVDSAGRMRPIPIVEIYRPLEYVRVL